MIIEMVKAACGCVAWVALCLAACVGVAAVIYTSKPEGGAK